MRLLLIIGLLFVSTAAVAFSPEQCQVLLKYGIYDTYEVVSAQEKFKSLKSEYCSDKSGSGDIAIPVGEVPFAVGGSFKSAMCSGSLSQEYEAYFFHSYARTIDKNLIDGVDACLKAKRAGVSYVLTTTEDPSHFFLAFSFQPVGRVNSDNVRVLVQGATCRSPSLTTSPADGEEFSFSIGNGDVQISCARDASRSVQITAAVSVTELTTSSIFLPAYRDDPPPKSFTFYSPQVGNEDLDRCASWTTNCSDAEGREGIPSATLWCHGMKLGKALEADVLHGASLTRLVSGELCRGVGRCDRITRLVCEAP